MEPTISLPKQWVYPRFLFGQPTNQGLVIGLEYLPDNTLLGNKVGVGWRYSVLPSLNAPLIKHFKDEGIYNSPSKQASLFQLIHHAQSLAVQIMEHPDYQRLLAQGYQPDLTISDAQTALLYLMNEIDSQPQATDIECNKHNPSC